MTPEAASPVDQFSQAAQGFLKHFIDLMGFAANSDSGKPLLSAGVGDTARLTELHARYVQQYVGLMRSSMNHAEVQPAPDRSDRRFSSPEWHSDPWFNHLRRSYLINTQFLSDWVEALNTDARVKERLRFITHQIAAAMSPANFAATNPEALKLALDTRGESLARGVRQLIEDVHKGRISTTDESRFEIGRNIAVTEGAVVFQNELMQLIQYKPLTETVFERPLVMIPPCINKYYIMDLQPENSLVRYALEQGHCVFMVSWRNVGQELGHLTWDDYIEKGVLKALDVARAISGAERVNALGFCVGGTLLGVALAVAASREEKGVQSATFLASMLDFSDTGEIGLFVDEPSIAFRDATIGGGGVMPGRDLALVFSALRANDLVWPYVVNNYLKGKAPEAFDLLYWNADSTNLPGPMYCWYVRNTYLENNLREPAKARVLDQPVDFGSITVPAYVLATREDHIVPWRTAFRTPELLGGETRFVLGASGHIAGVINPASRNKRSYWTGADKGSDADTWLAHAVEKPGSWWSDWSAWLGAHGGGRVRAPAGFGSAKFKAGERAPGSYVRHRCA